jgi:nitrite reductase/ring-hydroxylating ferredoxin subunit
MAKLVRLCAKADVPTDRALQVRLPGGEALAVCQAEGSFYVVSDTCSHGLASLSEGEVVGNEIYCPFHGGAFDIRTGKATERPCTVAITSYPVVDEGDTLSIEVNE